MPPSIDIAIIGAGPQALTLVTHMLQKKAAMRDRFVVIDPAGEWLHQWHHQFAALEIPHLRWPKGPVFDHHLPFTIPTPILRPCAPLPRGGPTSCCPPTHCPVRRCFTISASR